MIMPGMDKHIYKIVKHDSKYTNRILSCWRPVRVAY